MVQRLGQRLYYVGKIVSHQNPDGLADEGDRWLCAGNAAADALAANAFRRFPSQMEIHQRFKQDLSDVYLFRNKIHQVFVKVGLKAVTATTPKQDAVPVQPTEVLLQLEYIPQKIDLTKLPRRYDFPDNDKVLQWFHDILDEQAPLTMVSWFQLAILYERQTQTLGITYKPSSKRYFRATQQNRPSFVKRANHLSRWLQGVCGPTLKISHAKPNSFALRFWTMCITVRIREDFLEQAERYLAEARSAYGRVSDLQGL